MAAMAQKTLTFLVASPSVVVRLGATSSVLAPSSDALCY